VIGYEGEVSLNMASTSLLQAFRILMKAEPDPSPTLTAMRNLRASGEKSFEALAARLLMRLSGEGIRLCQAGTQGGVDAIADIPFAVEAKRHKNEVSARELLGGLANAALRYRDLELWVLASTAPIGAQTVADLRDSGELHGIETLFLDTSSSPKLPETARIVALAATDVDDTAEILADPSWRNAGGPPDADAIRAELAAVRNHPGFGAWRADLQTSLRDLPTWRQFVRSHNTALRKQILTDARVRFITPYTPAEAIPRDSETELTAWLDGCATTPECPIAVVVGERYDGKTWLVYRWLSENLSRLTLPVFFFSSDDVKAGNGHVDTMIETHLRRLSTDADRARCPRRAARSADLRR
jgi:Restriction endonuclease